tara:strand:- start:12819 stop:14075 length:1257 start_codon:yes stop_codon:yes gene_type:complete
MVKIINYMIFNKIKNSQKVDFLLNFISDFPFYIADYVTLFYCAAYNLTVHKTLYDKNFIIVTGSDSYFFNTLKQLLNNLIDQNFINKICVYDLGMSVGQIAELSEKYKSITITKFNFSSNKEFISKRDTHGTLGAYAWKPNIVWQELKKSEGKVIWLDSANLINKKFLYVLIVLTCKGFFSPMSAKRVRDLTHISTIKALQLPDKFLNKRNLTGGFVGFDWQNDKSRELASLWRDKSNVEELIIPRESNKFNHRWDQSLLTVLNYKLNGFGYIPKIKKIFGIKVNQNQNQDFFLFYHDNDKKILEFYDEWFKNNKLISTKTIKYAKVLWLLKWDSFRKVPSKYFKSLPIICNIESSEELVEVLDSKMSKFIKQFTTNNNDLFYEVINSELTEIEIYLIEKDFNKLTKSMIEIKNRIVN